MRSTAEAEILERPKLPRKIIVKLIFAPFTNAAIYALPLFLVERRLDWWHAWVIVGIAFLGTAAVLLGLLRVNTGLLEERMKPPVQKGQPFADKIALFFLFATYLGVMFFLPADVFQLHLMPKPGIIVSSLGLILFVVGWWIAYLSLRQNAFAAPVVKHQEERQHAVVDTGLYGVVRHPMYLGGVILVVGLPLWLESYAGALLASLPILALGARILIEERFLRRELPGYEAYTQKVRFRLIPHVW